MTDGITIEPPETLTADTVPYWCRHARELKGSQVKKAQDLVRYDCIRYLGNVPLFDSPHTFVVLPLNTKMEHKVKITADASVTLKKTAYERDYNWSDYLIFKRADGTFCCNCQAWHTRERRGEIVQEGANCAHTLGLYFAFKLKRFGHREGAEDHHLALDRPERTEEDEE